MLKSFIRKSEYSNQEKGGEFVYTGLNHWDASFISHRLQTIGVLHGQWPPQCRAQPRKKSVWFSVLAMAREQASLLLK